MTRIRVKYGKCPRVYSAMAKYAADIPKTEAELKAYMDEHHRCGQDDTE